MIDPKMIKSVSADVVNILKHWQTKWKVSAFVKHFTTDGAYHQERGVGIIKKTNKETVMAAINKLIKNGTVKYVHPSRRGLGLLTLTQQGRDS
jgi:recombination DNA repair RAD52 pathway protein